MPDPRRTNGVRTPDRKPDNKPPKREKGGARRISSFLYLSFWLLITVMFTGLLIIQARQYNAYQAELERAVAELESEKAAYNELLDQMIYYDSNAYIEQLARDQLGYVRPDEIVFVNVAD
jgi:cell division protein FtsB